MLDKQNIVDAIGAVAKRLGRAPSHSEFFSHAGISRYAVAKFFPKWNDAVRAAGLRPRKLRVQLQDSELLRDWGETARRKGALLSRRGYLLKGKYDPRTMENRFGGWSSLPGVFRKFAKGKREWAAVLALLPVADGKERAAAKENSCCSIPPNQGRHAELRDRPTYGNPMDFRGLRHEPVNEQGVIFLFGMLAKELGYMVERMRRGFPDCEAKRQIGPERWQRVDIEFEFESRNFRDHGHPASGCDVIVCWRHNWEECPENIEVVELSRVIKPVAQAAEDRSLGVEMTDGSLVR
jgi:HNH endonuclease